MKRAASELIAILALVVMLFAPSGGTGMAADPDRESPVRTIAITVPVASRPAFFDQLRSFAEANAFAIRVAPVTASGRTIVIQMYRTEVKATGANPFDPEVFHIGFFRLTSLPIDILPIVDRLIRSLTRDLSQVDGVRVEVKV